ncbi:MAG: starch synthase [Ilumatobacteraceae bacterium]|nr:starch synthase [Ilumatobacteraceae bacterium]
MEALQRIAREGLGGEGYAAPVKVLFASAEFAPLARVGGLAAAAAGLVAELRRRDLDVEVVLPDYFATPMRLETVVDLDVPEWAGPARARSGIVAGIGKVTLIAAHGIQRSHPYLQPDGTGWPDNDRRFMAFSAAVAALTEVVAPDVLHLNDWHTCAALGHLAAPPPTMLTIHTLAYQGRTNPGWLKTLPHHVAEFEQWGDCNPLLGGIRLADVVVAVSPHYAAEITTPQGGFGLDAPLREKGDRLVGVLNGIDTAEWDPQNDRCLPGPYSVDDLGAKALVRAKLLAGHGLIDGGGPLLTMVTRLAEQKGVDLMLPLTPFLKRLGATLIVLGDGDQSLADALTAAAAAQPHQVAFVRGYDEALAHQLFAGADVFVMPSRFEPCGLAQMQSMRYGTLPLVTDVGGLHDTVIDIDDEPTRGTGVVAPEASSVALMDGLHRMVKAYSQPRRRAAMQRRGMVIDWSWKEPAATHIEWYRRLIAERSTKRSPARV